MAKIIPPDPSEFQRTQCRSCYVKIEYAPDEVKSAYYSDYGGGGDTSYSITCPKCGNGVAVANPLKGNRYC